MGMQSSQTLGCESLLIAFDCSLCCISKNLWKEGILMPVKNEQMKVNNLWAWFAFTCWGVMEQLFPFTISAWVFYCVKDESLHISMHHHQWLPLYVLVFGELLKSLSKSRAVTFLFLNWDSGVPVIPQRRFSHKTVTELITHFSTYSNCSEVSWEVMFSAHFYHFISKRHYPVQLLRIDRCEITCTPRTRWGSRK